MLEPRLQFIAVKVIIMLALIVFIIHAIADSNLMQFNIMFACSALRPPTAGIVGHDVFLKFVEIAKVHAAQKSK